ncbi:hypothetical protein Emag_002114 [Eimeria magna]
MSSAVSAGFVSRVKVPKTSPPHSNSNSSSSNSNSSSSSSSNTIKVLFGCSGHVLSVCAFMEHPLKRQQQQQQIQVKVVEVRVAVVVVVVLLLLLLFAAAPAAALLLSGMDGMISLHLSHKRLALAASCNATDMPGDSSGSLPTAAAA